MFIMEGIDFAGVVDSDFQGIQINFALPRRICQFLRGGVGRGAHSWLRFVCILLGMCKLSNPYLVMFRTRSRLYPGHGKQVPPVSSSPSENDTFSNKEMLIHGWKKDKPLK